MESSVACGSGSPASLDARQAGDLGIPLKRCAERLEHRHGGVGDLRADAVAGDQGGWNQGLGCAHFNNLRFWLGAAWPRRR
jgi:hypothetical protein